MVTKVDGKYQCDKCEQLFDSMLGLGSHRRTCDGGNWRCEWCDIDSIKARAKSPGPNGPCTLCSACGSRFRNGAKGPPKRDVDGKYICEAGCGRLFDTVSGVSSHRRTCKGGDWRCQWCGCRESATCERAPGPDNPRQLCLLCSNLCRSGAPAPLRPRGLSGPYVCRICLRSCANVTIFHDHNQLCSNVSAQRRPHLQPAQDDLVYYGRRLVLAVTRPEIQKLCAPPPTRLEIDPRLPVS